MGIGRICSCMGRAFINGRMAGFMMENMRMTRSMGMGYISGLMGNNIWVNGKMENNMAREHILKKVFKGKVFGMKEN
jgi:hypothetical protein